MSFTDQELQVLSSLLLSEKAKVLEHTSRVDILEKIIKRADEANIPRLVDRVFELMRGDNRKTLNSVAGQIHAEKIVKGGKNRVYELIHRSFDIPISKDGEIVGVEVLADAMGNPVRHLFRLP